MKHLSAFNAPAHVIFLRAVWVLGSASGNTETQFKRDIC